MQNNNAKQHVQMVQQQLQSATDCLNNALSTVEKPQNRQKIQETLNAVNGAMQSVNNTLNTYQE
ncbi:EscE/YscE/SsaE family type III secretion system needle protein co-chaperone [Tepidibacter hydrothermalis]|uniref:EscE/YscE/SsaE family type III secretion system needle protein co-chaperone n=1 Tax=Tepidibacter hydrothermalis TaxID=3036126 RepID=A0ABY8EEG7_9FIRM|nr:EscE/YscE/SsaE family type III secretion system needle protein co-chaperone [Tepidibacter hydrothermalis]WFD11327.1 EscE/YscE/SsaE family type III secretion system needle protein co-chaperone [Tepidibacter hydrothermalis]